MNKAMKPLRAGIKRLKQQKLELEGLIKDCCNEPKTNDKTFINIRSLSNQLHDVIDILTFAKAILFENEEEGREI